MTQRQWIVVQAALIHFRESDRVWDEEAGDGPPPTDEEIDGLVQWLSDHAAPSPNAKLGDWEPPRIRSGCGTARPPVEEPDAPAGEARLPRVRPDVPPPPVRGTEAGTQG